MPEPPVSVYLYYRKEGLPFHVLHAAAETTDIGSALLGSAAKVLWMHKKDQWLFHRWIPHNCYRRFFAPESEGNTHLPGLPDPAPSGWRRPPDRSEFPVGNGSRNNSILLRRQPVKEVHMHI